MSRRRKKNPLLMRILVVSVVAHIIALPILAHFGAFERLKKEFGESRVVLITTPPVEEKKLPVKVEKKARKAPPTTKKSPSASAKSARAETKSNLPQPKVVAAGGDAGGDAPSVDPNGTGKAGELPTTAPPKTSVEPEAIKPSGEPEPAAPRPSVEPTTAPSPKPEPPKPTLKPRRFQEAAAIVAPEPTIPDDLRSEPFEKTLIVEADVDPSGIPTGVKVATSTGVRELDNIGLETARKYRFRPASLDDEPVPQHVRFRIVFKVE